MLTLQNANAFNELKNKVKTSKNLNFPKTFNAAAHLMLALEKVFIPFYLNLNFESKKNDR